MCAAPQAMAACFLRGALLYTWRPARHVGKPRSVAAMSPVALSPPLAQAEPCRRRAHGRRLPPAWSCCASTTPSSFDTGRPSPPARAWEGGSPDVARLGMWDTPCLEGPSCCCIRGSVDTESLQRCEELYLQARASYFAGHPHVADDMFDKLEVRTPWPGDGGGEREGVGVCCRLLPPKLGTAGTATLRRGSRPRPVVLAVCDAARAVTR